MSGARMPARTARRATVRHVRNIRAWPMRGPGSPSSATRMEVGRSDDFVLHMRRAAERNCWLLNAHYAEVSTSSRVLT